MSGPLGIPSDYGGKRGLRLQAEATELVSIGENPEGRDVRLTATAARAWANMKDEAFEIGITLVPISGFRSVERQTEIIRAKLAAGQSIEDVLRKIAAPGYSEHHTGRAIDIGVPDEEPLTERFAETTAFSWLEAHAPDFGFTLSFPRDNPHGIAYEPWHWCFRAE
jgi:zinc D-Ala-D-Ala carboxypeptidase